MDLSLSLSVVFPLCLYICAGVLANRLRWLDEQAVGKVNRFLFKAMFPLIMFENVMNAGDALRGGNLGAAGYLLAVNTVVFVLLMLLVPRFVQGRPRQGSVIQGCFRANSVLFALPIVTTICGADRTGVASVCVSLVVPYYNMLCVIALESKRGGRIRPLKLLKGVLTNPLILGALAGAVPMLLGVRLPELLAKPVHTMTSMVTPLALMLLGANLRFAGLKKDLKPLIGVSLIKLIAVPLFIVGGAWLLGFRGEAFVSVFALSCVPTAVSSYSMAVEMDADGPLAAEIVAVTTVCSMLAVFLWVSVLSGAGAFAGL